MVNFNEFMNGLSDTNATLAFFTDFDKVKQNISKLEMRLNQLNYLLGKKDLKKAIEDLFKENPKVFDILNLLIAVRDNNKKVIVDNGKVNEMNIYFKNPNKIYKFFKETGLKELFINKEIKNLVDYVFGVEVGLDTNARKNRSGTIMEDIIEKNLNINKIPYKKQVNLTEFPELKNFGIDLKRFDFTIKTKKKTYLIEVNYYSGGGSKLNETARSYTELANKISKYKNFEFVWITDGKGWYSAKSKIEEAYTHIKKIYNLKVLKNFIKLIKSEL